MEPTEGKLKRLRNLPAFKDKTEEELIEYLKSKPQRARKQRISKTIPIPAIVAPIVDYDSRYDAKLNQLKDEFGIDMNDANDAENLRILVSLLIQREDIDKKITTESNKNTIDTGTLKALGEVQKNIINSITDIQDKLGITRKARKEKQIDDIPQYLKEIRRKAREFWDRETTPIRCEKCQIELSRYWLNFPKLAYTVRMELECWKCGEKIVYVR